jgi:hypothetical protein
MMRIGRSLAVLSIGAGLLASIAAGQEQALDMAQRLAMAESVIAREEAASERGFDPSFRTRAMERLATLPMEALLLAQTQEGGLGLNVLGDSQADLVYTPVTPCRIIDTRLAGGVIAAGMTRDFLVTGTNYSAQGGSAAGCGIPFGPTTAVMVNFVAVNPRGAGNLRVTPYGKPIPVASIINFRAGVNLANGIAVAVCDPSATTCLSDLTIRPDVSATDVVADVQGYFQRVSTGGVGTALLADSAVTAPKISAGTVVRSLNGQTDALTLAGANGLGVSQGAGTVTVASNATPANTPVTIVSRDGSGSFSAGSVGLAGTLDLPNTTSASTGMITLGGTPFLHNFGSRNTFVGNQAGNTNMTGNANTGVGLSALHANTTGWGNVASGEEALLSNTTGYANTAVGDEAMRYNSTGYNNSAFGDVALYANTTGGDNSAVGYGALGSNKTASYNSALGSLALALNTTGAYNSAVGYASLNANTTGQDNSAFGANALQGNTTGLYNSAFGYRALQSNTTANNNSALGSSALQATTTGWANSAFGSGALSSNTTGFSNSAFGALALSSSTTGAGNSAFASGALFENTTGYGNSAFGYNALLSNTTGVSNSALGYYALDSLTAGSTNSALGGHALEALTTGDGNLALGEHAGFNLTSGNNNVYLANQGASSEDGAIRIGTSGTQTAAYVAGISGAVSGAGIPVLVNPSGQLGTSTSSERFKDGIRSMEEESDVVLKLRPVTFYYKPQYDETHTRQYGLVAEEVAEVAPGLVAYGKDGTPQAVRYHFVNAMLLNEVQKLRWQLDAQEAEIRELRVRQDIVQELRAQVAQLEARLPR